MRVIRPADSADRARMAAALDHLRAARDLLRQCGSPRAVAAARLRKAKREWVVLSAFRPEDDPFAGLSRSLKAAGVELSKTYPDRMVDHARAREKALASYDAIKK